MERHGTTVDAACAEWLEGVEMYGGEVQFAAVMRAMASPASDPDDLTDDWISYAASHC